jgi:glycine/D-amino acid oxidase-like deaminating enzyme
VYTQLGSTDSTAQVHPRLFTEALIAEARSLGATVVTGCVEGLDLAGERVRGVGLDLAGERVRGVQVNGALVPADAAVVAMGPWSNAASRWLPLPAVDGLKGFSITLAPSAPVPAQALFVEYMDAEGSRASPEIFPRPDGEVYLCGLSDDQPLPEDPADISLSPTATKTLRGAAGALASSLDDAPLLTENACYRPVCADALPLMGAVPGVAGAFVATGHNCWGILNAPASGAAMAELIAEGSSTMVDLAPFTPARFKERIYLRN